MAEEERKLNTPLDPDRMYAELHERRALVMHKEHNLGDEETTE